MIERTKLTVVALVLTIAIAVGVALLVYLYQHREGVESSEDYIVVQDFLNRSVMVPKNVKRVVAVGPGMLRLVAYLRAVDLVVGVEEAEHRWTGAGRDYHMAYGDVLKTLPVIGPGGPRNPPDPEKIASVKPDLVIMSLGYANLYDPDRLSEEVGAPVIVVDYSSPGYVDLDPFKRALRLLGKVLNREKRAEELCRYIDSIVQDLFNRTRDIVSRPTVYVGAVSYAGKRPFTSTQIAFPPLLMINTRSIADDVGGRAGAIDLDFEYILSRQPDVIFIDLNNLDIVRDDFSKDPGKYCALKAFREGRVYAVLPFNYYHTNIATALANAYYMGKVLYPERFADVDPIAKADEIYMVFLGKTLYQGFVEWFNRGFSQLDDVFRCGG